MITKPFGKPIKDNPAAERRRKYFAKRYLRRKAEGKTNFNPWAGKARPDPHKEEAAMLKVCEAQSRKPYHASAVTWLEISSGRSNS